MDHAGIIYADRGYTLGELASIIHQSKEAEPTTARVKFATVRKHLNDLGVPQPKFGQTVIIPGILILRALERSAAREGEVLA